jgi:hypothetical protein
MSTNWRLLDEHTGPRGGWTYRIPEDGSTINSGSVPQLVRDTLRYYQANRLPIPTALDDVILTYICETYWQCTQNGVPNAVARGTRPSLGLQEVIRFSQTLFGAFIGGTKVTQAEADRRASICASCPANVHPEGCTGCNSSALKAGIALVSRAGKTKYDPQLFSCRFCGCFINSVVWFPLDVLQKNTPTSENRDLPAHCWKKSI